MTHTTWHFLLCWRPHADTLSNNRKRTITINNLFTYPTVSKLNVTRIEPDDLEFGEKVGRGAFAEVFKGRWISRNMVVAIKKFTTQVDNREVSHMNFAYTWAYMLTCPTRYLYSLYMWCLILLKVEIHSSLDHPNIGRYYGYATMGDSSLCIVMGEYDSILWIWYGMLLAVFLLTELAKNGTLRGYLKTRVPDAAQGLQWAKEIAQGMSLLALFPVSLLHVYLTFDLNKWSKCF